MAKDPRITQIDIALHAAMEQQVRCWQQIKWFQEQERTLAARIARLNVMKDDLLH